MTRAPLASFSAACWRATDCEVDSSESAEQALEYPASKTAPDVIFMDHLMPGMDGFQAIQAIKGNPDTAMIPVVMYTSQEGELYVSQARALGAVGVLPKTVKQSDVSRVLYQLRLLPERRDGRAQAVARPRDRGDRGVADRVASPPVSVGEIETAIRNGDGTAAEGTQLPRCGASCSRVWKRSHAASLRKASPRRCQTAAAPAAATCRVEDKPPSSEPSRWPLVAAIAALALLPTLVLAVLYTRTLEATTADRCSRTRGCRGRGRTAGAAGDAAAERRSRARRPSAL